MKRELQILTFEVSKWTTEELKWSENEFNKFPVHEHYQEKEIKFKVRYRYDPGSKFERSDLIRFLILQIKKQYRADKVKFI